MAELRKSNALGSRLLEFAILCASRSAEARNARWSEVDLNSALWVIPKERIKTEIEHRVPLSAQAVALLQDLSEGKLTDYIFPGEKEGMPLSDMTMTAFIRRQNKDELKWKDENGEAITQHGFRSTFMDWASETTPFPAAVADMALAHVISDKVRAAYQRGDLFEKRQNSCKCGRTTAMARTSIQTDSLVPLWKIYCHLRNQTASTFDQIGFGCRF